MRRWVACFVFVLLSAAIAKETDPRPKSSEKLKLWRIEQKSSGNGCTFPTSALGKTPEDENENYERTRASLNVNQVGMAKDDNEDLPIGNKIAIFLVGLTTPATAPLVIPSLLRHVIQVWGPESVDFFVHTSPLHSMAMNGSDVVNLYEIGLRQQLEELRVESTDGKAYPLKSFREVYGEDEGQARWATAVTARAPQDASCLQVIVVDKDIRERETFYIRAKSDSTNMIGTCIASREDCIQVEVSGEHVWVPRIWVPPVSPAVYFQFHRLAHLYPYMLAEETRVRRRYSHVVRMRTDAMHVSMWEGIKKFHEIIPPLSKVVAGPGFDNIRSPSYMPDTFWIASRAAASSVFVGFAHSLETQVDRKELWEFFNCQWPPNPRTGSKFCDAHSIWRVFGENSVFGEIRLKYYFLQRFKLVDSHQLTGCARFYNTRFWRSMNMSVVSTLNALQGLQVIEHIEELAIYRKLCHGA